MLDSKHIKFSKQAIYRKKIGLRPTICPIIIVSTCLFQKLNNLRCTFYCIHNGTVDLAPYGWNTFPIPKVRYPEILNAPGIYIKRKIIEHLYVPSNIKQHFFNILLFKRRLEETDWLLLSIDRALCQSGGIMNATAAQAVRAAPLCRKCDESTGMLPKHECWAGA